MNLYQDVENQADCEALTPQESSQHPNVSSFKAPLKIGMTKGKGECHRVELASYVKALFQGISGTACKKPNPEFKAKEQHFSSLHGKPFQSKGKSAGHWEDLIEMAFTASDSMVEEQEMLGSNAEYVAVVQADAPRYCPFDGMNAPQLQLTELNNLRIAEMYNLGQRSSDPEHCTTFARVTKSEGIAPS